MCRTACVTVLSKYCAVKHFWCRITIFHYSNVLCSLPYSVGYTMLHHCYEEDKSLDFCNFRVMDILCMVTQVAQWISHILPPSARCKYVILRSVLYGCECDSKMSCVDVVCCLAMNVHESNKQYFCFRTFVDAPPTLLGVWT